VFSDIFENSTVVVEHARIIASKSFIIAFSALDAFMPLTHAHFLPRIDENFASTTSKHPPSISRQINRKVE
jgi:hypothetical protein